MTEPTAATLQAVWSRSPRQLTHGLAGDPTLQPEALAQVAQSLPAERIECHLADLALVHPTGAVRRTRQQADEVLRDLANQTAWVMLVLQSDAEGLAEDTVGPLIRASAGAERGMGNRYTTVFAASPGAVVPVHFDVQHNILLQVAGTKRLFLGAPQPEATVEACVASNARNLRELPAVVAEYELSPGRGLYVPPYVPHWIIGGADVSISLSCAWQTVQTLRESRIRRVNARLRWLGLRPGPPGLHTGVDRAKDAAVRLYSVARRRR